MERFGNVWRGLAKVVCGAAMLAALGCAEKSPEALLARGKEALEKKNTKDAIIHLKNALQGNPDLAEARFQLASAHYSEGEIAAAEKEFGRAVQLGFDLDRSVPALARAQFELGEFDKVIGTNLSGLKSAAAIAEVQSLIGDAYLRRGQKDKAAQAYGAASTAQADNTSASLGQARLRLAEGDTAGAKSLIAQVLAKEPQHFDALALMSGIERAEGRIETSIASAESAVKARPTNMGARFSLATLYIDSKKLDLAKQQVAEIRTQAPRSPAAPFLSARISVQEKNMQAAREAIQQALRVAPDYVPALALAGTIEFTLGSYDQAEQHFRKALDRAPGHLGVRRGLAATFLKLRKPDAAHEVLEPVLKVAPDDTLALTLAGEAAMRSGDFARASQYLERAAKRDPQNAGARTRLGLSRLAAGDADQAFADLENAAALDSEKYQADLVLITAHAQRKEYDKALAAIKKLEEKQPNNPLTHNLRGVVLIAKNDRAAARQALGEALKLNPTYFAAIANLAKLDVQENKLADAQKRFEALLEKEPKNSRGLLALAELKARGAAPAKEIEDLLVRARSASPGAAAPAVTLGRFYLVNAEPKKAIEVARDALSSDPNNAELLDLLGTSQRAAGEPGQAAETFTKLAAAVPESPLPYLRIAEAHAANNNESLARDALKKALEIKPNLPEARVALAQLDIKAGKTRDALRTAQQVQKEQPKAPAGYLLEADAHARDKKWSEAAGAYKAAYGLAKDARILTKMHSALLKAGKNQDADAAANDWLKANPNDTAVRSYLGELAIGSKDYKSAAAIYEKVVQIQPGHVVAMNNLAWTYGQLGDERAIATAEAAVKLAPKSGVILDTLGTLHFEKGNLPRAVEILETARTLAPENPQIRYHLAQALFKSGRKPEAKQELETALAGQVPFPEEAAARELLGRP